MSKIADKCLHGFTQGGVSIVTCGRALTPRAWTMNPVLVDANDKNIEERCYASTDTESLLGVAVVHECN